MICQNCQKRLANVHLTQIVNEQKTEIYLCEQCAREKKQIQITSPIALGDFLSSMLGANYSQPKAVIKQSTACSQCGMTYEEFKNTGKIGCANCFETFRERMEPVLKRIHGNLRHTGKAPSRAVTELKSASEVEHLKAELARAIQTEQYEKAAQLRDRIRLMETQG